MPTTQWSLIERLNGTDPTQSRAALEDLCSAYHYPLYCLIRRHGLSHHDAEDVLHDFFLKLLRNESFGLADSDKGRLRSFLLVALKRFLATWHHDQLRHARREISIQAMAVLAGAESRFELDESANHESPDVLFDRQWGIELMNQVMCRLESDYIAKGKGHIFTILKPVLLTGGSLLDHDSTALASLLAMKPGTLRVTVVRLLQNYRQALRHEILQTVEGQEQASAEFNFLLTCFNKA